MRCASCGAATPHSERHCRTCRRELPRLATAQSYTMPVRATGVAATLRERGAGSGDLTAIVVGAASLAAYPWTIAAWAAATPGTPLKDVLLGLCWLLPELYLLSGVVKAAQWANSTRRAAWGLVVPAASLAVQVLTIAIWGGAAAAALNPAALGQGLPPLGVGALMGLFAVCSVAAALIGAYMPRVVPGKFSRLVAPQLGCLSLMIVALLLPTWGALALIQRIIAMGITTLWIDIAIPFVFGFFALYWFWPTD